MGFIAYDNYGTISTGFSSQVAQFYEEDGLINLAFTTDATYHTQYGGGPKTGWFDVNTGSFTPGVTYYGTNGAELVPSAGSSMMGAYFNKPDDNSIADIGFYFAGDGTRCFYSGVLGAGVHTPSLAGYNFTPSSETASQAIGVLFFAGEVDLDPPDKATNPSPANTAVGVTLDQATLTWTEGSGADYEQVYFGLSGNMVLVDDNDIDQSFSLASYLPFPYNTTYQWRIDSVNDNGTTTGDTWSFTTLVFTPPGFGGVDPGEWDVIKRLCACSNGKFWYEDI